MKAKNENYSDEQIVKAAARAITETTKEHNIKMICILQKGERGGVDMTTKGYEEHFNLMRNALENDTVFREVVQAALFNYIEEHPSKDIKVVRKPKEAGKVISLNQDNLN